MRIRTSQKILILGIVSLPLLYFLVIVLLFGFSEQIDFKEELGRSALVTWLIYAVLTFVRFTTITAFRGKEKLVIAGFILFMIWGILMTLYDPILHPEFHTLRNYRLIGSWGIASFSLLLVADQAAEAISTRTNEQNLYDSTSIVSRRITPWILWPLIVSLIWAALITFFVAGNWVGTFASVFSAILAIFLLFTKKTNPNGEQSKTKIN